MYRNNWINKIKCKIHCCCIGWLAVWRRPKPNPSCFESVLYNPKPCSSMLCVYGCVFRSISVFFAYVCVCLEAHGPLRWCCLIWSGFCGLHTYCAPLVCVSDVIGGLVVWWHNKPFRTTKKQIPNNTKQNLVHLTTAHHLYAFSTSWEG